MVEVIVNSEREKRVAVERIVGFAQKFGVEHLNLACHAAFPLSLTPDLLYQIWAYFVPEAPWTAVARVLLSRLCKLVGYETYEMDNAVRNLLLKELKEQFGQKRLEALADFILEYVEQRLIEDDPDTQDLKTAQTWTALAYTQPTEAAYELAQTLREKVNQDDIPEIFRLTSLANTLAEPLIEGGFQPLLVYSRGLDSYVRGDLEISVAYLREIFFREPTVNIAGVPLPLPRIIEEQLKEPSPTSQPEPEPTSQTPSETPITSKRLCSTLIIAIGGTGAKCAEAIIHLAAVGLFPDDRIGILFVDPDESNGNINRARNTLHLYQRCYALISDEEGHNFQLNDSNQLDWLKTPIEDFGVWSPFKNQRYSRTLNDLFAYQNLRHNYPEFANLFEVLYPKSEREADLHSGFRGRPAIGAAVMSRLDWDEYPWQEMMKHLRIAVGCGKKAQIFLCGSLFGGTGASGLSIISRLIHHQLEKDNMRRYVKLGGGFLLPYFRSSMGSASEPEIYEEGRREKGEGSNNLRDLFVKTEEALSYYGTENQIFDAVYLLGTPVLTLVNNFSIGRANQINLPHFIELYAGLAAQHFVVNTPKNKGGVFLTSRHQPGQITWQDLPDHKKVKEQLVNATRFAYVWLTSIAPDIRLAREMGDRRFQRSSPWFSQFFYVDQGRLGQLFNRQEENLPYFNNIEQQGAFEYVKDWSEDYLRWLSEIHQDNANKINLFNYRLFSDVTQLSRERSNPSITDLFLEDYRTEKQKSQDTIQKIKNKLTKQNIISQKGAVGLAKALYILCKL